MAAMRGSIALFVLCATLLLPTGCARPKPAKSSTPASTLLFNGSGTSPNDVAAIEKILQQKAITYDAADSSDLNAMTEDELLKYHLIIFPGGNYITIGNHLSPETTQHIRFAIHKGTNYLGICAGALLAGNAQSNTLSLTGVHFNFYAAVNHRIHKAAVPITYPESPTIEHYWEDGPELSGWGQVVAKYPDGTPAIVQGPAEKGWIILCGTHPEAPDSWRKNLPFSTPARPTQDYAATLIDAALHARTLPHY
jgi:glutamine amidotransferase PdxT